MARDQILPPVYRSKHTSVCVDAAKLTAKLTEKSGGRISSTAMNFGGLLDNDSVNQRAGSHGARSNPSTSLSLQTYICMCRCGEADGQVDREIRWQDFQHCHELWWAVRQ